MARKFLYFVAFCIVVYVGGRLALQFYPGKLSQIAFVPSGEFKPQPRLAPKTYDRPEMWISRPAKGADDPARWLPEGAQSGPPLPASVFFLHPTSYLDKAQWNASLDDKAANERAKIFVRANATAFNASAELWAPRYRQAAFGAFLSDAPAAGRALDLAYADVLEAFDAFLAAAPRDRPIVLAGHSQGSYLLKRLLKDRVAGTPLARRIAAVYVIGWPVSQAHDLPAMGLPACTAPDQVGCVMSWLSFAEPADAGMMREGYARRPLLDGQHPDGEAVVCTNPLTGGAETAAPASANLGTLVPDLTLSSGKLAFGLVPARCGTDGFLLIGAPPALGPFVLPGNNYHVYDTPLFWANTRADVARRVAAWKP